MTRIDQFQSVFKSAVKQLFQYNPPDVRSVLVITDLDAVAAQSFGERVQEFLIVLGKNGPIRWRVVPGDEFHTVQELLDLVHEASPDLICSYRTLHSNAWKWGHSLGSHLDVLTQVEGPPVLVLPHPQSDDWLRGGLKPADTVMAMTDHLTGDHRLVNYAVRFTAPHGTLHLANVEDSLTFERYIDAISKVPTIETDEARESIMHQLLKESHDYADSCRAAFKEHGIDLTVEDTAVVGKHLSGYKRLIEERRVALLVLNTKDHDQLAMHGLAYPLAVEMNHVPLLML